MCDDSPPREVDESGEEFEDQEDLRCKLLQEAELIHHIVPRQNLGQIYAYLEANVYHKNRVQIVMQEFLRMDTDTIKKNDCETNIHPEPQPSTSKINRKYKEQFNTEAFLENIPDPFKYFLKDRRNHFETDHAMSYLKRRYRRIRYTDLRSTFFHNHRNLTLTCEKLDHYKGALFRCKL